MIRRFRSLSRRLCRDSSGIAATEFGFVAPVMFFMIMAGFDSGYTVYLQAVAAGTLEERARAASLSGSTESQFDSQIRESMYNILPDYARTEDAITLTKRNYTDYSRIDAAEKITFDDNENGQLDVGDCWEDEDGNGEFGVNEGAEGLGGADDGVYYTVQLKLPRLFPLASMAGLPEDQMITVRTLVINQPYGTQAVRETVCLEE
jgi:Flp pilus assembly protein TadG